VPGPTDHHQHFVNLATRSLLDAVSQHFQIVCRRQNDGSVCSVNRQAIVIYREIIRDGRLASLHGQLEIMERPGRGKRLRAGPPDVGNRRIPDYACDRQLSDAVRKLNLFTAQTTVLPGCQFYEIRVFIKRGDVMFVRPGNCLIEFYYLPVLLNRRRAMPVRPDVFYIVFSWDVDRQDGSSIKFSSDGDIDERRDLFSHSDGNKKIIAVNAVQSFYLVGWKRIFWYDP